MKHLKYLSYVVRHKWFVFVECCKLGIPWRGLTHDLSKFLPSEWFPYVEHFYGSGTGIKTGRDSTGYYKAGASGKDAFDFAWLLHQKRNRHHWQWWMLPMDQDEDRTFEMPIKYRLEMLADWRGAGRAQGNPDVAGWYAKNGQKMTLGPKTREWIEGRVSE